MNAIEQCRTHIAPTYSDWDFALRGLDESRSAKMLGLISFITRINDIPHRASEIALAKTQLQWWHAQVNASTADLDTMNTARHPSLTVLGELAQHPSFKSRLQRLLDLVAEDIEFAGFATTTDMQRFFRTRGAITLELYAEILGADLASEHVANVGYFLEHCDLLKNFAQHATAGVVYFAQTDLAQHGWIAEQIISKEAANQQSKWAAFFAAQTQVACDALFSSLPSLGKTHKPLRRLCNLRYKWLLATQAHGYPLYRYQLALGSVQKRVICFKSDWL